MLKRGQPSALVGIFDRAGDVLRTYPVTEAENRPVFFYAKVALYRKYPDLKWLDAGFSKQRCQFLFAIRVADDPLV